MLFFWVPEEFFFLWRRNKIIYPSSFHFAQNLELMLKMVVIVLFVLKPFKPLSINYFGQINQINKSGNLSQNMPVWDIVNVLRNIYFTKRPSSRYNFRPCLVKIGLKLFELESRQLAKCLKCTKWPCDLVFDPAWPIFELDLDIIKIQLLTTFGEDRIKTIWIRVRTMCWMFKMH